MEVRAWSEATKAMCPQPSSPPDLVHDHVLFRNEIRHPAPINKVRLVLAGRSPFLRLPRRQQRLDMVEPKLRYAVIVRSGFIAGNRDTMALYQTAQAGNPRADGTVNVPPVTKEFLVAQPRLLRDAVHDLDHER
jgi:hypothetical protein